MEMNSFQYIQDKGWSVSKLPTELDSEQTIVFIFAAPLFIDNQEPIKELANGFKNSKIIGCSSSGEIFGAHILDKSLSVVVVKFAKTPIRIVKAEVNNVKESFNAGQQILEQLGKDGLRGVFVLSDGLRVNGSELVKGLNKDAMDNLVVTGGLAGDGSNFKKTWTIYNGEILENHVVAIGFYGDHISIGHASKGGWDIFGPMRRITHSVGNVLYELDNQPALKLYKEYLGERAADLPSSGLLYPLAISDLSAKEPVQLVRTILAVDEKEQSLTFAGDVPVGFFAQLMRANFDRLISSASGAAENALIGMGNSDSPVLAISVSCVGRRLLLGERTEEETESTLEVLPEGSTQVGFYSYGEVSPSGLKDCELHNQTMTLTLLGE
ncbi:MAG: hypothetical protein EPN84_00980, partial [Legionella sp.]